MKPAHLIPVIAVTISVMTGAQLEAQTEPVFPQIEGLTLNYRHYGPDGQHDADCSILLRNVIGDNTNGGLEMVYRCTDSEGEAFFSGPNECVLKVSRQNSRTSIDMDRMSKTLKIMNLISAGDVSNIRVPMSVGETLPDTEINSTLGIFKATLTISDKIVLDHRNLTVDGKEYECWLVHEKILTKTPFSTDTATAETWYAKGAGCINQTVYDGKGRLKGKLELISVCL